MAFSIEILTTDSSLIPDIQAAIQPLNNVQSEFRFTIATTRLLSQSVDFRQEAYTNIQIADWLRRLRDKNGGSLPYLILVINKPLSGTLSNLFGSHRATEGLAWFTTESFDKNRVQFVFDRTRFCRYYLVRYVLSFINPNIKGHEDTGCMFDRKIRKQGIRLSYDDGNICDSCLPALRSSHIYNAEVAESVTKFQKIVGNQYPRTLVMKGGGVKGLALVGALKVLEQYFSFNGFAGTSAGAITATLLAAGYTPDELEKILTEKNFNEFKDPIWKQVLNFFTKKGLHSGVPFYQWIENLLKIKVNRQVSEIKMMDLTKRAIVYATTVGQGILRFDSSGDRKETTAAFATRCSMSIPGFFAPEEIEGVKVFDGGIGNNFPLRRFITDNGNELFIGLYLISDVNKKGGLINNIVDIATDNDEREVVDKHLDKIVIIDPRPIKTTQFNLSKKDKEFLLQSGKVGALTYLNRYHPDFEITPVLIKREEDIMLKMRDALNTVEN